MLYLMLQLPFTCDEGPILSLLAREGIDLDCQIENREERCHEFYARLSEEQSQSLLPFLPPEATWQLTPHSAVDWDAQWQSHAPHYSEGRVEVPLITYEGRRLLQLTPGPGFGDLSHATTQLALQLLQKHSKGIECLDMGTGSGILALAACAFGARHCLGVDIDAQALLHAGSNIALNAMESQVTLCHSGEIHEQALNPSLLIMNMLPHEQKAAYSSLPRSFVEKLEEWVASGVIEQERDSYLLWAEGLGWHLKEEEQHEGWWAFYFERA